MSRFKKSEKREVPSIGTASLPDLIFTLLFFFILITNFREPKPQTELEMPVSTQIEKLTNKNLATFIYVAKDSYQNKRIQLNNDWINPSEITNYLINEKNKLHEEDQDKMTVVLKIDKGVKMKDVFEIKESIKKADVLLVNYAVEENHNQ